MIKNPRIHDQTLFFTGLSGLMLGIFLWNIFLENTLFLLFFVGIVSIQILFFFRSLLPYIFVFLLLFSLGGYLSFHRAEEARTTTALFEKETVFFTKDVLIIGTLVEKISENEKNARYVLRDITVGNRVFPEKTWILLSFPDSRGKNIDDVIAFTGRLALPTNSDTFDYRTYLLLDNIYVTTRVSFPDKIGVNPSNTLSIFIRDTKERLLSIIERIYPGESAKLLEGILLGERANLSSETKNNFNTSGLTHIIAVSGFNITIILIFLSFLFRSFPVIFRIFLAFVCIGFFTLLVGPQVSVLRASAFGLISYVILLSGRKMRVFSLLMAVAMVFILLDPLVLNHDISFHLSFLAVFGLLFFGDAFNRIFSFLPKWFGLRESLAMCFAAMVFTLPIILVNFGQLSLVSPLSNLLVVPAIPIVMLLGFMSILVGFFSFPVAIFLGFPTWFGLSYILHAVSWLGNIPYAAYPIDLGVYKYIFEITYFLLVGLAVVYFQEEK